ncbi:MAG: energy transducer TonB [Sphingobium sp.]|nr:energy transducer TonB [Sphingobium sp.]
MSSTAGATGRYTETARLIATEREGSVASPAGGGGPVLAANSAAISDYQRRLYDEVARHARYPAAARLKRLAGVTHLAFRIDRLGNVLESWVQDSSGSEMLDNAALEALNRALPLPPIPPSLPSPMNFEIAIDSSLMPQFALSTDG